MRWLVLLILLSFPSALAIDASNIEFSVSQEEVLSGEEVFISFNLTGASGRLTVRPLVESTVGSRVLGPVDCPSTCKLSGFVPVEETTTFVPHVGNIDNPHTGDGITVSVVDNVKPDNVRFEFPETASISVELTAIVEFYDASGIDSLVIDFGDSNGDSVESFNCGSDDVCETTFTHTYEKVDPYVVTVTATDTEGASRTITHDINIHSELDDDADGVLNDHDECPDTSDAFTVATAGNYTGCACEEVDFSDSNLCTIESCSINASGELDITHTDVGDGESPPNSAGTCEDGDYIEAECAPDDSTVCFGDVGDQNPYCHDGESPYNRIDTCASNEVCQVVNGDALCVEGEACLSSPGCRVSQPSNTEHADGVCDTGRTCYSCQDGWHWDGLKCVESLDCSPLYFNDNDGDGQGAGTGQCSEQFPNPVTNSLDCNDNNEDAYVGAIEICDGVDNDCDGEIDEDCV